MNYFTCSPKWTRTVLQDEDGEQLLDSSLDELSLLKTHRRADDAYRRRHGPMATRKRTAKDQGIVVATPRDPRSTRVIALLTQSASGTVPRVPRNTSFAVLIDGAHKQAMEILQRAVGDEKLHLERVLVELDDWFTQYVQRLSEAVRSLDVQQRAQRATVDGLSQVKLDVERTIGVHARMQAESLKRYQAAMQRMVTRTQAMAPVSERELRLGKEQDDYADDIPVLQACRVRRHERGLLAHHDSNVLRHMYPQCTPQVVLLKARVRALLTVLNAVQGNDCSASIVKRAASAAAEAQLGCLDIVAAQQEVRHIRLPHALPVAPHSPSLSAQDRAVAITSTATQCPDPQALTELHRVLEACERAAVAAAQQAAAQRKAAAAQRVAQAQAKQNREMEAQEHFALRRRAGRQGGGTTSLPNADITYDYQLCGCGHASLAWQLKRPCQCCALWSTEWVWQCEQWSSALWQQRVATSASSPNSCAGLKSGVKPLPAVVLALACLRNGSSNSCAFWHAPRRMPMRPCN